MSSLLGLMLERSFTGRSEFDHRFMSAGQALGRCLEHFGAIEWKGSSIVLKVSEQDIMMKIERARISELPALSDVLDVLLKFLGQYGTVPKLTDPLRYAEFDLGVSKILREMQLLDENHVVHRALWPSLVDHFFLLPNMGGWNENVRNELWNLCTVTWDDAPEEFKAFIEGRSDYRATWAEGYMMKHWRYGRWLTEQEEARSIETRLSFLAGIVCRTLMNGSKEVYVPPKFLQ